MKWKITAAVIAVAAATALFYFGRQGDEMAAPQQSALQKPRHVAAEGKVEARPGYDLEIGSELTARIERFRVKEGDAVQRGQVIVELATEELAAQLRQAEAVSRAAQARHAEAAAGARDEEIEQARAALKRAEAERDLAEQTLQRSRTLYQDRSVAQATLDENEAGAKVAQARLAEADEQLKLLLAGPRRETLAQLSAAAAAAEANVKYLRTLLAKSRVTSPIDGTVIQRYLDEGEVVMPEKPIAVIADTTKLRINAEVDETNAGRLNVGDAAEVSAYAYPGKVFKARVGEIARYVGKREIRPNNPAVNLGLKIIQVKLELLEPVPLQLGMTVDVKVLAADGDWQGQNSARQQP